MELTQEEKEKLFKKKQETKDLNSIEKSLSEIKQILKDKENINVLDNKNLEELRKQLLSCYNLYKKIENSFEKRMNLLDEKAQNLSLGAEDIKKGISEGVKASAKEVITNEVKTSLEAVKTNLTTATDKYVKEMEKAHEKANKSVLRYVWLNRILLLLVFASIFTIGYLCYVLTELKTEIRGLRTDVKVELEEIHKTQQGLTSLVVGDGKFWYSERDKQMYFNKIKEIKENKAEEKKKK